MWCCGITTGGQHATRHRIIKGTFPVMYHLSHFHMRSACSRSVYCALTNFFALLPVAAYDPLPHPFSEVLQLPRPISTSASHPVLFSCPFLYIHGIFGLSPLHSPVIAKQSARGELRMIGSPTKQLNLKWRNSQQNSSTLPLLMSGSHETLSDRMLIKLDNYRRNCAELLQNYLGKRTFNQEDAAEPSSAEAACGEGGFRLFFAGHQSRLLASPSCKSN